MGGFGRHAASAVIGRLLTFAVMFLVIVPLLVIAAYDATRSSRAWPPGICVEQEHPGIARPCLGHPLDPWFD